MFNVADAKQVIKRNDRGISLEHDISIAMYEENNICIIGT